MPDVDVTISGQSNPSVTISGQTNHSVSINTLEFASDVSRQAQISSNDSEIANLTGATGILNARQGEQNVSILDLQDATGFLNNTISGLQGSTGTLSADISTVSGLINVSSSTSISGLQLATGVLNSGVSSLETATGILNSSVSSLQTVTGALNSGVSSLETATGILNSGVLSIQTVTGILDSGVSSLQVATGVLTGATGSLSTATGTLNTNISTVSGLITSNDSDIANLNIATGILNSGVSSLETATGLLIIATGNLSSATGILNSSISSLDTATGLLNVSTGFLSTATGVLNSGVSSLNTATGILNSDISTVSGLVASSNSDISGLQTATGSFLTSGQINTNINTAVSNLVDSAPGTLNTLNELAAALGDDANFSTTVTNSLSNKVNKSETGAFYLSSNPSGFITGLDLSALEAITGILNTDISTVSGLITSNDSDISALQTATGLLVQKSETGAFALTGADATFAGINGNEINVAGGDGYLIDNKQFAKHESNVLKLGDHDGENFTTDIFGNGGVPMIRITGDGSQAANTFVGIGTTSPEAKLHVLGNTKLGGNVEISGNLKPVGDVSGNLQVSGNIIPAQNVSFDLGSASKRFKHLFLSGNSIFLGNAKLGITSDENLEISGSTGVRRFIKNTDTGVFLKNTETGNFAPLSLVNAKPNANNPEFTGDNTFFRGNSTFFKTVNIFPPQGRAITARSTDANNSAVTAFIEGPVTVGHDLFKRGGFTDGFADGNNHFHDITIINLIEQAPEGDVKNLERVQERYYAITGNNLPNNNAAFWAWHRVARPISTTNVNTTNATLNVTGLQASSNRLADSQKGFQFNTTPSGKSEEITINLSGHSFASGDNARMIFGQEFEGPIVAASLFGRVVSSGTNSFNIELYGGNYKTTSEVPTGVTQTGLSFQYVTLQTIGTNTIVQNGNEVNFQHYAKTNFAPNRLRNNTVKASWSSAHGLKKNETLMIITDGRGDLSVKQGGYVIDPDPDGDGNSAIIVYGRRVDTVDLSSFTAFGSSNWSIHKGSMDGIHDDTLGDNLWNFNANNVGEYKQWQAGPGCETDADCISIGRNVYNRESGTIKIGYENEMLNITSNGIDTTGAVTVGGNLGIGTTTPEAKLDVSFSSFAGKFLRLSRGTTNIDFDLTAGSASISSTVKELHFGPSDGNPLVLKTSGLERARIDESGNFAVDTNTLFVGASANSVGIRTSSPRNLYALHVNDNFLVTNGNEDHLNIDTTSYNYKLGDISGGDNGSFFEVNSAQGTASVNNAAFGIGVALPQATLHVNGTATVSGGLTTLGKTTLSSHAFVIETGSFTLGNTHKGATVLLQNSASINITVPSQVSGYVTTFIAETHNSVSFITGSGMSGLNSFNGASDIAGIYGQAQVIYKSAEYAFLGGNVV